MTEVQVQSNTNLQPSSEPLPPGILSTSILQIQNKRYYFDIKEHEYGRFLKLAETAQSGRKSRLVIPMYLVPEVEGIMLDFEDHLKSLPEFHRGENGAGDNNAATTGDNNATGNSDSNSDSNRDGATATRRGPNQRGRNSKYNNKSRQHPETEAAKDLKSAVVERGRRRYYFNLKENTRGRYLRVKAIGDIPNSIGRGRGGGGVGRRNNNSGDQNQPRAIILPAIGIADFRKELKVLLTDFAVDGEKDIVAIADKNIQLNGTANDKLPASKKFASRNFRKVIFLDAGENSRGFYARMTEQQNSYREAVTIPSRHFKAIGEWFTEAAKVIGDQEGEGDGNVQDGSGDATVAKLQQQNGNGHYDEEDDSSEIDVVNDGGNRRREAASDSEE